MQVICYIIMAVHTYTYATHYLCTQASILLKGFQWYQTIQYLVCTHIHTMSCKLFLKLVCIATNGWIANTVISYIIPLPHTMIHLFLLVTITWLYIQELLHSVSMPMATTHTFRPSENSCCVMEKPNPSPSEVAPPSTIVGTPISKLYPQAAHVSMHSSRQCDMWCMATLSNLEMITMSGNINVAM